MWLERLFHTQVKPEQRDLLAYRAHTYVYVEIPQCSLQLAFSSLSAVCTMRACSSAVTLLPRQWKKSSGVFPGKIVFPNTPCRQGIRAVWLGEKLLTVKKFYCIRLRGVQWSLTGGYKVWCWNGTELKKGAPFCNKAPHRPNNHCM